MTDADYTHITILADKSGSMGSPTDPGRTRAMDTTDGIRALLRDQAAAPGRLSVSLATFSSGPHDGRLSMTKDAWFKTDHLDGFADRWTGIMPYGGTPLLDAIGMIITDTGTRLSAMPEDERPGRVMFVISTDGEENMSQEYSWDAVKALIRQQQDQYKWDFLYIGIGEAAFMAHESLGFSHDIAMAAPGAASMDAYVASSSAMTRGRAAGPGGQSVGYADSDREDVIERKWSKGGK